MYTPKLTSMVACPLFYSLVKSVFTEEEKKKGGKVLVQFGLFYFVNFSPKLSNCKFSFHSAPQPLQAVPSRGLSASLPSGPGWVCEVSHLTASHATCKRKLFLT